MNIQSMIHFYGTLNLDRTHQFYVDVLGLTLHKDQGLCHIYALNQSTMIGFCTHIAVAKEKRSPIITLVVDDVLVWHQHITSCGYKPDAVSINEKFRIEHFFLEDPNGYTVEIQRFL